MVMGTSMAKSVHAEKHRQHEEIWRYLSVESARAGDEIALENGNQLKSDTD